MSEGKLKDNARNALEMRSVFAPGPYFFCRRIELPADVEDSEISDYATLQIESMSPFPVEHLQFGYATDREGGYLFVYAAYRRRFEPGVVNSWAKQELVVPEFLVALLCPERESRELCLVAETSISLITYDRDSRLPAAIRSFPRSLNEEEEAIDPRDDLAKRGESLAPSASVWWVDTKVLTETQRCFVRTTSESDGGTREFAIKRDDIWPLDIRDADTLAGIQAEEQKNVVFWKAILATAACLALLLLGELFYAGFTAYASYKEGVVRERQPTVDEINSKNSIATNLIDFQDATLEPFDMLLSIEPFRPESVYFNKVASISNLQLEVDAFAPSQAMANQFKTRIERSQNIESVEIRNPQNQPSGTRFTAILTFKPGALADVPLPVETEEASG